MTLQDFNKPLQESSEQSTSAVAHSVLMRWLADRVGESHIDWLQTQIGKILKSNSDRDLHITLGLIPRKLSRADLSLTSAELREADQCCAGWTPSGWSVDRSARIAVLCSLAQNNPDRFDDLLPDLFRNADLTEAIDYYSGIALYPRSENLDWQIGEGLRSNMRAVFEAIAHNNPYPARHFDENRWNHMVLKALFVDSTLAPIYGLDQRANAELALILCDYAHERWAAGRPVSPELWRCVGRYACGDMINDLQRAANSNDLQESAAGVLALTQCPDIAARQALSKYPDLALSIGAGNLSWESLQSAELGGWASGGFDRRAA